MSYQTEGIDSTISFTSGFRGFGADGVYAIPLNNHPHFDPGQNIIDQRKAIGIPVRRTGSGFEFQQAHREPRTTYEFDANAYLLAPFFWLLFQNGASEGSSAPYAKTFTPYTSPDCEVWASLLRKMSSSSADSHVIHGAIVRSIRLTAETGGPLRATVEFIGYSWDDTFNASSAILNFSQTAPLLWKDAGNVAGIYVESTNLNIRGFDITFNNNATAVYYSSQYPEKFVLGDLTVEGEITVPWDAQTVGGNYLLNKFVNGEDVVLHIWWGSYAGNTVGDFSIKVNMRFTGAEVGGETETEVRLPFIHAFDGVNNIEVKCVDNYQMSIP